VLLALLATRPLAAQEPAAGTERLGIVHFPVSCSAEARARFERAAVMLHHFWTQPGIEAFAGVTAADSGCAMGYWGMAMILRQNPLVGAPDTSAFRRGREAAARARAVGAPTPRERGFIAAMEAYYEAPAGSDHRTRVLAYERAMADLRRAEPGDLEAAAFHALALLEVATVLPAEASYARQREAIALLEEVLAANPAHPGALHYLIHGADHPPLAARGLSAAERYGTVAPSSPHALHMPSHVFSMLGMWDQSIRSNRAAVVAARTYVHAMDFLIYALLQQAKDGEAAQVVEETGRLLETRAAVAAQTPTGAVLGTYTAFAAISARHALERGAWREAGALAVRPATPAADAVTHFARAMGAVRSGEMAAARDDLARLRSLEAELRKAGDEFWAVQVGIQGMAVAAWMARAEGRDDEALRLMRRAADLEDSSGKSVAMENRLWPMRELLGELLLELGAPAEALAAFEASLQAAPNRYRGFLGAARSAARGGDRARAREYYGRLLALTAEGDGARPELAEARGYLGEE
jgi:tetratricopeptide (TPR) repeat protein